MIKFIAEFFVVILALYSLISNNQMILELIEIKYVLGVVLGVSFYDGIRNFSSGRKLVGLCCLAVAILATISIIRTIDWGGIHLIPMVALFIVFGVPIAIIAMFASYLENKNKL